MVKQNAVNLDVTVNADGFDVSAGTTKRKLTVTGGDVTLTGAGAYTYTFPTVTSTLIGDPCPTNAGTANTGVTAVEHGDGYSHVTTLTVSQADALTLADNASLGVGYKLYDFPAGAVVVDYSYMSMGVTAASTALRANTPDVGMGTVIAAGEISTLDGTATFEDIITGQTATNTSGTATVKTALPTTGTPLIIASSQAHTVYFNVAAAWGDDTGGDLTADIAGTVVLAWRFLA